LLCEPKTDYLDTKGPMYKRTVLNVEICQTTFSVGARKNFKKWSKHSKVFVVYFGYMGTKSPGRIEPKFLEDDILDVITCFRFGDDRFRGLASAEGQILPYPIDWLKINERIEYKLLSLT